MSRIYHTKHNQRIRKVFSSLLSFILILLVVTGSLSLIRLIQGDENVWRCQNSHWSKLGNPETPQPKVGCPQQELLSRYDSPPPEKIVEAFYNWYLRENNLILNQEYKTNNYLSENLKQQLTDNLSDYDLIFCSGTKPLSFHTVNNQTVGNSSLVKIEENFVNESYILPVELKLTNNRWQVEKIDCNKIEIKQNLSELSQVSM